MMLRPLTMHLQLERWPLAVPFRIAGYTFSQAELLVVTLESDGLLFLVGQLCSIVDLDGALLLEKDRTPALVYDSGWVSSPRGLWG
jgi:hypothetical protein